MRNLKNSILGTVAGLSLLTGIETKAQTNFSYGPITNNTTLAPIEIQEWLTQASSANTNFGSVSGNTNNWVVNGSNALVIANPNVANHYRFINWTTNGTQVSTNSNYTFPVNSPVTNLVANFDIERFDVVLSNATSYIASPTNWSNVAYGGSVTSAFPTTYFTNAPGSRKKVIGIGPAN